MSTYSLDKIPCEDIQVSLDRTFEVFGTLSQDFTPLLNFLNSPVNTANVLETIISPGNGKNFNAKQIYTPRITEDDVSTSVTRVCTSSNEAGMRSQNCEVDLTVGVQHSETWDYADLAPICEPNPQYEANRLGALINVLRRKMETEITSQVAAGLGGFPDDDTDGVTAGVKVVQTLQSGGVNTDLNAIEEIGYTKDNIGIPRVYTFGSGLITKYFKRLDAGCCVDGFGVDLREFAGNQGVVHAHSYRVANAFDDANDFIVATPGAAHLVSVPLWAGSNRRETSSYKKMTIVDPLTGVEYDLELTDTCSGIVVSASLAFKVCFAPTDMFALNDRMSGVNGLFHFRVTNP